MELKFAFLGWLYSVEQWIKTNKLVPTLFEKKSIDRGDGHIVQYTIFESKYLFSVLIFNWKSIKQDRFHSHAFSALCFLLSGSYEEETFNGVEIKPNTVDRWMKPRLLSKSYTHRILRAMPNTWTLVLVGPWQKYWYEYFAETKTWVKLKWGRVVLSSSHVKPTELSEADQKAYMTRGAGEGHSIL
jgi:hypothetical protein